MRSLHRIRARPLRLPTESSATDDRHRSSWYGPQVAWRPQRNCHRWPMWFDQTDRGLPMTDGQGPEDAPMVRAYWLEPPEMVMTCPLTHPPSSEHKKATTLASSPGSAHRPSGQFSAIIFSICAAGMSGVPNGM